MRYIRFQGYLAVLCLVAIGGGLSFASPSREIGTAPAFRPEQAVPVVDKRPPSADEPPVADGIVDRYLLHPRGIVDGLLLRDGAQIHVTPRAAEGLIQVIQPGDHVRVHGRRGTNSPLVTPDVIVNVTDGTSFTVPYRLDLPIPPAETRPTPNEMRAGGTIQVLLYDYMNGAVNGMLLSDDTQVRLPPDVGKEFPASLQPHMEVEVEGYGMITRYGRALEAIAVGRKGHPLTQLDASTKQLR